MVSQSDRDPMIDLQRCLEIVAEGSRLHVERHRGRVNVNDAVQAAQVEEHTT
jgi:hypothetical protein